MASPNIVYQLRLDNDDPTGVGQVIERLGERTRAGVVPQFRRKIA